MLLPYTKTSNNSPKMPKTGHYSIVCDNLRRIQDFTFAGEYPITVEAFHHLMMNHMMNSCSKLSENRLSPKTQHSKKSRHHRDFFMVAAIRLERMTLRV